MRKLLASSSIVLMFAAAGSPAAHAEGLGLMSTAHAQTVTLSPDQRAWFENAVSDILGGSDSQPNPASRDQKPAQPR